MKLSIKLWMSSLTVVAACGVANSRLLADEPAASPAIAVPSSTEFPKPSAYPTAWELKFDHSTPHRIVVEVPGSSAPIAYWYMTYTITNHSDREQLFLPVFELLTTDGQIIRSDRNIPNKVFVRVKELERKEFLEQFTQIGGELRIGEDQQRDGVAIWQEPTTRMGSFSIFVTGLSGETAAVKGPDGIDISLRKTLRLNYHIRGDEVYPGEDELNVKAEEWVMR